MFVLKIVKFYHVKFFLKKKKKKKKKHYLEYSRQHYVQLKILNFQNYYFLQQNAMVYSHPKKNKQNLNSYYFFKLIFLFYFSH